MSDGLCKCGCGQPAQIAKRTRPELGHVKGQPTHYARGHNSKTIPIIDGKKTCSTCKELLPLDHFQLMKKPSGLTPHAVCTACAIEYKRRRRREQGIPERVWGRHPKPIDPKENRRRVQEWRRANPDKWRAASKRDFQRRRGAPFTKLGREYAEQILRHDPCSYCGAPGGTVDHIVAVQDGGDSDWQNLTAACLECNSGKGPKPLLSYLMDRNR